MKKIEKTIKANKKELEIHGGDFYCEYSPKLNAVFIFGGGVEASLSPRALKKIYEYLSSKGVIE